MIVIFAMRIALGLISFKLFTYIKWNLRSFNNETNYVKIKMEQMALNTMFVHFAYGLLNLIYMHNSDIPFNSWRLAITVIYSIIDLVLFLLLIKKLGE